MGAGEENAREVRRQANDRGHGAERPKRLNPVALHRRRVILGKAMAERRVRLQAIASQRFARRAFWLTAMVLAALAAGTISGLGPGSP